MAKNLRQDYRGSDTKKDSLITPKISTPSYQGELKKTNIFWRFFTFPITNPIELYIVGSLYKESQYHGVMFSQDDLRMIISGALLAARESDRDLSSSPSSERSYTNALTAHNFLNYDPKTKIYCLTQPGVMLGQSLWQLRDPRYLYYDERYLEEIFTQIRLILENWRKKVIELSGSIDLLTTDQHTEIDQRLNDMLKNEQQLMNFNQLQIQVVDLSYQAIKIAENLKKITSQLQADYIEGVHQKRDFKLIKDQIDKQIEKYEVVIGRLNQKSQDISNLIQNNRKNIEKIEILAEELRFRFDELIHQKFFAPKTNVEEEINSSLTRLISICVRLEDFASQLHRTVFDITLKRVNTVRFIFKHLRELIQNTQLLGDLYNIWRIGIFQNLVGKETFDFTVFYSVELNKWTKKAVNDIPIEDFRLKFMNEYKIRELSQKIKERNLSAQKTFEREQSQTAVYRKERSQWESLINKILKNIEYSKGLIDLNQIIFELSQNTRFNTAEFYPRLFSMVWEHLVKRFKITTVKNQSQDDNWSEKIYEFEGGLFVKVRTPMISVRNKGG